MIIIIVDGHQEAVSLQAICLPAWFPHIASPNSSATKAVLGSLVIIIIVIIIIAMVVIIPIPPNCQISSQKRLKNYGVPSQS